MSAPNLHDSLVARLQELYGGPENTVGKDSHWALRPYPDAMAINVLVNGSSEQAIVWVFDPYDDGVTQRGAIQSEEAVDEIMKLVRTRLDVAATIAKPPDGA